MTTRTDGAVNRQLSTLFNLGVTRDLTDGQLLEQFSTAPREVAEPPRRAPTQGRGLFIHPLD